MSGRKVDVADPSIDITLSQTRIEAMRGAEPKSTFGQGLRAQSTRCNQSDYERIEPYGLQTTDGKSVTRA
eukprot:7107323-Pyramimonas_sp.AAC.1